MYDIPGVPPGRRLERVGRLLRRLHPGLPAGVARAGRHVNGLHAVLWQPTPAAEPLQLQRATRGVHQAQAEAEGFFRAVRCETS